MNSPPKEAERGTTERATPMAGTDDLAAGELRRPEIDGGGR
jgi:hypothetical protein